jgi:hypothetical protein
LDFTFAYVALRAASSLTPSVAPARLLLVAR